MAHLVLFHHALGLTDGCRAVADELRADGHLVHTPDLYDGQTFDDLTAGIAHAEAIGFDTVIARGVATVDELPDDLVYVGMSLGVMPAQVLAQTRPGARGAIFLHASVEPADLGGTWPAGLPVQIHTMEDDEWGDVATARWFEANVPTAQVFVYPGNRHLFTDSGAADHDPEAARQVMSRMREFLASV